MNTTYGVVRHRLFLVRDLSQRYMIALSRVASRWYCSVNVFSLYLNSLVLVTIVDFVGSFVETQILKLCGFVFFFRNLHYFCPRLYNNWKWIKLVRLKHFGFNVCRIFQELTWSIHCNRCIRWFVSITTSVRSVWTNFWTISLRLPLLRPAPHQVNLMMLITCSV